MKRALKRAKQIASSPCVRPLEVWLARAAIAYVAAKLGVDAAHLTK